ncbi:MAG TPA: helix-turn-helix transcriptional regulator, partial [Parapedobacter sp.]|nr:helix-turn-helix transcriptional regulator [Parapedobacter sp.]
MEHHIRLSIEGKPRVPERAFAGTTFFYVAAKVPAGAAGATLQLSNHTLLLVLNGQSASQWTFSNAQAPIDIPPFAFFAAMSPPDAIEVQHTETASTVHCIGFTQRAIPLLAEEFERYADLAATTTHGTCTLPHRFLPYTVYKYLDRLHTTDKQGFAFNIHCKDALYQTAKLYHANLTAAAPKPRTTLDEDLLLQTKELIQSHFSDPAFNVDSLAEKVGLSRRNLYRLFENQGQLTPQKLILRTRLEKAHDLLKDDGYTVGDVATLVGFNHSSYFSAQYKSVFG